MRVGATDGEATKPSEASAERHKDTEGYLEFYVIYVFFVAGNTENLIKTIHFV